MAIPAQLLDQVIKDYKKPEDLLGGNGIMKQLTKALLERVMQAEMTEHLGYPPNSSTGINTGNSRNGSYKKKLKGDFGEKTLLFPVTATQLLNLLLFQKVNPVSKSLTIKSSPSMHVV